MTISGVTRRPLSYNGLTIVESFVAYTVSVHFEIERWPLRKRRRGWCVKRREIRSPCAYMLGDHTLVVPPETYDQLLKIIP